jgi:ABC-2 type transport system permease protein
VIALLRTEFVKAVARTRTWVIGLLLVGLPTLIVVAINAGHRHRSRGNDSTEGLFRLAQQSGLLVPAAVLSAMSGFLLIVIAGTFAGDSVAGDAAWGNLRYLLMRPVPRGRLLVAKTVVAGVLIWVATILVAVTALIAGAIVFGAKPLTVPSLAAILNGPVGSTGIVGGFHLTTTMLLTRTAVATAYVAFGFTALLALGVFFSTLTDAPAGAIGGTVGVYIVSEILDAITQLGKIRYAFPTHYLDAWQPMFTENRYPHDMAVGIGVQLAYLAVFGAIALTWFRVKDIRS